MFIVAKGTLRRDSSSDPKEMLIALKKALEAKTLPKNVTKSNALVCDAAILGSNQSKTPVRDGGGFRSEPPGNWITLKLFFGNDEGECFLNMNTKDGIGEFSIKDSDYGDVVLRELAKVL
jgi:hypothetical protein